MCARRGESVFVFTLCGFLDGMSVSVRGCLNQNISLCAWSVLTLARGTRSVDKKNKKKTKLFGEASKT